MNQFESGSLAAIADVPEDLVGKVVQGQPVRIVQTYIGDGAEVLVANLAGKEFPIMLGFLCSLEDSCKARAASWFLCVTGPHRESLAAYEQVVRERSLERLEVWHMFEDSDVLSIRFMMRDLFTYLMLPYTL